MNGTKLVTVTMTAGEAVMITELLELASDPETGIVDTTSSGGMTPGEAAEYLAACAVLAARITRETRS